MIFSKKFLQNFGGENVIDEYIDHTRWSVVSRRIFKFEGKYYETIYSEGATEMQDERPYEWEDDEIECQEVFPKEVTITIYVKE